MNSIWTRTLSSLLLVGLLMGALYLFGYKSAALICGLLILLGMLLFHVWHIQKLWRLLDTGQEIPDTEGIWGEVHYRLQRLIKNWNNQTKALEQEHKSFIQAIQASPNGVLMLGAENQIEWCNGVIEAHFGINIENDQQQRITHLVRRPDFVGYLNRGHFEEPLTLREMGRGHHSVVSLQIFPYEGSRKLLLTHDITKQENTEAMRRDFVANVSHELKTPLTVLRGFLETVRDLPLTEADRNRYLDTMLNQSLRMQQIVEDLLTLASLEANKQAPALKPIGMQRLMQQWLHDAQVLCHGEHQIDMQTAPELELLGNEVELTSAFTNLITNALRYTPKGGKITLKFLPEGQNGAVFSVTDSGLGIEPEHLPRLTERFYRVDRSRSRDSGGTGLGLAIVKHVLSRHHADLKIQSELGKGSEFSAHFSGERVRHNSQIH